MDIPNPAAVLYRVFVALRKNPCTIEVVTNVAHSGAQWIRLRNDSDYPIQIIDIDFEWRSKSSREFDQFDTPLAWVLADDIPIKLKPGETIEHAVDAHEAAEDVDMCKVSVVHNRSRFPSEKKFKLAKQAHQ